MSLILALKTYEGIIMCADRLSTLYIKNDKLNTTDCFPKSFNTKKIFLTQNGYGIAYCGESKIKNNILLEQFIQENICSKNYIDFTPKEIALDILHMINHLNISTTFLLCGYFNEIPFIFDINFNQNEVYAYSTEEQNKVFRFGDTSIVNKLLDKEFYYGYDTYRTQDAINLLLSLNQTTAKFQQFQETLQTVSYDCDVLILFKNGTYKWIIENTLHI